MRKRFIKNLNKGDVIKFYSKSKKNIESGIVIEAAKGELIIECLENKSRLINITTKDLIVK